MNRRELVMCTCGVAFAALSPLRLGGQTKPLDVGLASLADGKGVNASKRTISHLSDGVRKGVRLSEELDRLWSELREPQPLVAAAPDPANLDLPGGFTIARRGGQVQTGSRNFIVMLNLLQKDVGW